MLTRPSIGGEVPRATADIAATVHLKAAFAASGSSYGSRLLIRVLQTKGLPIGRYRVRALNESGGIACGMETQVCPHHR